MLKVPSPPTLEKYGLSKGEWVTIAMSQNSECFVCETLPKSNRLCIDHEHAKGWKKMPASDRKKYVRGLLCYRCNRFFLARGMNQKKAERIKLYLDQYEGKQGENKSTTAPRKLSTHLGPRC